jgi:AraC family transcriptional regulator
MDEWLVRKGESVRSSKPLGWPHIVFSVCNDLPAQEYCCHVSTKHHLVIHKTAHPVRVTERTREHQFEGWVKPGDIYLLPAGTELFWRWESKFSLLCLELTPAFLQQIAELCNECPTPVDFPLRMRFRDPKLLQIGSWFAEELNGGQGGRLYVESLTNILGIHFVRHYTTNSPVYAAPPDHLSNFQLSEVIDYMRAHLQRDISLTELAQAANVSPQHLVRLFKRATGFAPHQYLIHLRIQRAKELLMRGGMTISEIAALTGFADQSHLSRHFKRIVGCTPKAYLNQISF